MTAERAAKLVEQGLFEWVTSEGEDRRGKPRQKREPAIRAKRPRHWAPRESAGVTVLQLVP